MMLIFSEKIYKFKICLQKITWIQNIYFFKIKIQIIINKNIIKI